MAWVIWCIHKRAAFSDHNRNKLLLREITKLQQNETKLRNYIQSYARHISELTELIMILRIVSAGYTRKNAKLEITRY